MANHNASHTSDKLTAPTTPPPSAPEPLIVAPTDDQVEELAPAPPAPAPFDMASFAAALAQGIRQGGRPKITLGEYDPKTPFHPNKATAKHLRRPCYQNGSFMHEPTLFDREVELLNAINRSGRYISRKVEIRIVNEGTDSEEVYIGYNNKTVDQRMDNKNHWRNLVELLEKVVAEQAVENTEKQRLRAYLDSQR